MRPCLGRVVAISILLKRPDFAAYALRDVCKALHGRDADSGCKAGGGTRGCGEKACCSWPTLASSSSGAGGECGEAEASTMGDEASTLTSSAGCEAPSPC